MKIILSCNKQTAPVYFLAALMYDAPMPLTLYRYLTREVLSPLLLGLVTFTVVLLMGRMLKLADMVVSKGVPVSELLLLIAYLLPNFAMITIPMALLLAVLLAFSRLSADSEIVAIKASGTSLYSLLPPVMAIATVAYAITTIISLYALPLGNVAFKKLLYHVIEGRLNLNLKEQVFNSDIPGLVIYIDRNDEKSGRFTGIMIQDERNPKELSTIFAASGTLDSDTVGKKLLLHLTDGSMHQSTSDNKYRRLDFKEYDLSVDLSKSMKNFNKNEQDMTLAEIRSNLRKGGFSKKLTVDMGLEVHRRFALPFACIIFAIVAMPLGIQNRRSGKAAGFSFSIAAILVYYVVQSFGRTLGEKELLHPALAIWLPNIIFLAGGLYLFRQAAREQRLEMLDRALAFSSALFGWLGRRKSP
ncbi:MAG TPA: LPS export ABC transporter permease LptF [Geobacteraceae bacterium]|nr:LPS export ABC transporter permease LptF [Geobacteraceae bacterium]